ncbi:hypothetical protein ACHAXS_000716 [Conticribra weissflogii]
MKNASRTRFNLTAAAAAVAGTAAVNCLCAPSSAFQPHRERFRNGHTSRASIMIAVRQGKINTKSPFPMQQDYDLASKLQLMAMPGNRAKNNFISDSVSDRFSDIVRNNNKMNNINNIHSTNKSNPSQQQQQPQLEQLELQIQLQTLSRILLPSLLSSLLAYLLFPPLALQLSYLINDSATFAVLSVDSSQFIQNFLTVTGLTFSILVGQTYYFMYQQQEAVFVSLFGEVTEAKSLLEQVALVCQGRRDMYEMCLGAMREYVEEDLKRGLGKDPALSLSGRPMDDPLEVIMYLTSVGIPSSIYDTVRSLRQARATRLAALQKKLPPVHLLLLWLLALIELSSFPVLGAGTQTIGGYNILTIEGVLFGIMTFGIVLTLNVVGELYVGSGGAYNVDSVLGVMVKGLDEELEVRLRDVAVMDDDGGGGEGGGGTMLLRGTSLRDVEQSEMERRRRVVMPSPSYFPMRYSSILLGEEDSVEASNI